MEKIFFKLIVTDDYPPVSSESVWAESSASGSFIVKNIPFYSKDACLDDEILIKAGADGERYLEKVITSSGNSTIRIIFFDAGIPHISIVLEKLVNMGCTWEGMSEKFFSVNIPVSVSLDEVIEYLNEGEDKELLDYEYGLLRQ
ncbi:DUF4265 domain-containing protein [Pseudomonas sp. B21-015]|uniref:DUF4265 domain-containing protein n=1 Tax=Pseudomonas sp. B21-015 TaxID=2895473 RepID=UPI00215E97EB|nr:DUF4265 domain-containing protein [Pseudomonas sp. B21-015]UVM48175.1 DUF4265 domain-containing protein [Pseudomonas sp. B21-015]